MKGHFSSSLIFSLLLSLAVAAHGQSCTTATCNAASANEADVIAALPSSGNTNSTVVVNIPAGTSAWTSRLDYTIPAAVTNLTIQGATNVNCTGTPGAAGYSCPATDSTVIQDSYSGVDYLWQIITGSPSTEVRLTGLTLEGGANGGNKGEGILFITGNSQKLRIDHNHFNNNTYSPALYGMMVRLQGGLLGVADHNLIDLGGVSTSLALGFVVYNPFDDTIGNGDGSWANPTGFGGPNFFFIESNYFNGGLPQDCDVAGRYVERYNYFNAPYVAIRDHGTKTAGGPNRGCRGYEGYHNFITGPGGASTGWAATGSEGGPALIWGNTLNAGYYVLFAGGAPRNISQNQSEISTPNGWGFCGTSTQLLSGALNGIGSKWDGNNPLTSGYPCLDGIGRGQTKQALNGQNFPNRLNSSTGTIAWPQQMLEPTYLFMNTIPAGLTEIGAFSDSSQANRDLFYDCGPSNSSCSGGFTGTAGTGYGTTSARPSTCSPGPGGTYFTSPTGSYGVAYFATDANGGSGELYACTAANTWTPIYQPYAYPHPLVSGTSTSSSAPPPPTGLVSTAN